MHSRKQATRSMLRADVKLSEWLRWATVELHDAGVESARFDAERLAAHGLAVAWSDIWARMQQGIAPADLGRLDDVLTRRRDGEPLGYVVGSVVFYGVELECGPGVLVPRPETESVVDTALDLLADKRAPVVVDVGTGTGAIAIAIALRRPDAAVYATDLFDEALRYARRNVDVTGARVRLHQGDIFGPLPNELRGRVDLVVSNPPYVPDYADLPPDVAAEPARALRGGPRGDEVLKRLVRRAADWLAPDGALAIEIGSPEQSTAIEADLVEYGLRGVRDDHTGRPRVVWATR